MKVINVNGTSDNKCKCGSWLNHWKNFSGQSLPGYCTVKKCLQGMDVGAHVQKDSYPDKGWYIIPLCDVHNKEKGQSLNILDSTTLVSANVSQTCGKSW